MKVGVDIDNVLCDSMPPFLRRINERLGTILRVRDITEWNMTLVAGKTDLSTEIINLLKDDSFVVSMPAMRGAASALAHLESEGFDIVLLTHRHPETTVATFRWVMGKIGKTFPIYHTQDKANHGVSVLVDDAPQNIEAFLDAPPEGKRAIIYDQPWNAKFEKTGAARCFDWDAVVSTLRRWNEIDRSV